MTTKKNPLESDPKKVAYAQNYVEHGSDEHAALLGLNGPLSERDPERRADLEAALEAGAPPTAAELAIKANRPRPDKNPVTRANYRPGDEIMAGFHRVG